MTRTDIRVAIAWACVGVLLLVWSIGAAGANSGARSTYEDEREAAAKQLVFWRIVAGEDQGGQSGVFHKLARDIRDTPTAELGEFRGDSNRYGGITHELGYDPFNGPNCSECGPLDMEFVEMAMLAKRGRIHEIAQEITPTPPQEMTKPPVLLWLAWALAFPGYMGGALLARRHEREERYKDYTSELELIENIDEAVKGLPPAVAQEVMGMRDRLMAGIDQRIKYGDEAAKEMRLTALTEELQSTLDAINEGNRMLER